MPHFVSKASYDSNHFQQSLHIEQYEQHCINQLKQITQQYKKVIDQEQRQKIDNSQYQNPQLQKQQKNSKKIRKNKMGKQNQQRKVDEINNTTQEINRKCSVKINQSNLTPCRNERKIRFEARVLTKSEKNIQIRKKKKFEQFQIVIMDSKQQIIIVRFSYNLDISAYKYHRFVNFFDNIFVGRIYKFSKPTKIDKTEEGQIEWGNQGFLFGKGSKVIETSLNQQIPHYPKINQNRSISEMYNMQKNEETDLVGIIIDLKINIKSKEKTIWIGDQSGQSYLKLSESNYEHLQLNEGSVLALKSVTFDISKGMIQSTNKTVYIVDPEQVQLRQPIYIGEQYIRKINSVVQEHVKNRNFKFFHMASEGFIVIDSPPKHNYFPTCPSCISITRMHEQNNQPINYICERCQKDTKNPIFLFSIQGTLFDQYGDQLEVTIQNDLGSELLQVQSANQFKLLTQNQQEQRIKQQFYGRVQLAIQFDNKNGQQKPKYEITHYHEFGKIKSENQND